MTILALLIASNYFLIVSSANSGAVSLTPDYHYHSIPYNTNLGWQYSIYMDSLNYNQGADSHITFINVALGAPSNPSWTFGAIGENGSVNITAITSSLLRFNGITSGTLNLTFYYIVLPISVNVTEAAVHIIPSASYFLSYAAWVAAAAPAVYENATGSFLMVKSAFATPIVEFDQAVPAVTSSPALFIIGLALGALIAPPFLIRRRRKQKQKRQKEAAPEIGIETQENNPVG